MSASALPDLRRYALLSLVAAVLTIGLKLFAWKLTGSVGLLSDAYESLVNLAGALMALWMLQVAARPADAEHEYGHTKAEYFASGLEGLLILLAAALIAVAAVKRLIAPVPLEAIGLGLGLSLLATAINLGVGLVLLRVGKKENCITLEADGKHLLTDVWTSVGVVAGIGAVWLTGWLWLDPVIALLVAAQIVATGLGLTRRSVSGLMDATLSAEDRAQVEAALAPYRAEGIDFHALRSRQAGARRFLSFHVLMPGHWTIQAGHDKVEEIEAALRARLPRLHISSHLEPIEDPASLADAGLDRE
ncbi:MAG: cation diffusion facilitator family transporter [Zoogloeaceae bacterium]|jgi:cation diffusion facilitator family transporter|nr:cation diffusion facilitator family transporter [Zoogloeaceae bacterium]